jgi:DNA-binding NtrC family response regulator
MATTLKEHLRRHEKLIILQTLRANGFSRKMTAGALGITPQSLWLRINRLGITSEEAPVTRAGRRRTKITVDSSNFGL